jgi:hypothetical protein
VVTPVYYEEVFDKIRAKSKEVRSKVELQEFMDNSTFELDQDRGVIEGIFSGDFCEAEELFGVNVKKMEESALVWGRFGGGDDDDLNRRELRKLYKVVRLEVGERLPIYKGPSATFSSTGFIPGNGTGVRLHGECQGIWCEVSYGKARGWVQGTHLTWDRDKSDEAGVERKKRARE